jgi:predicted membrane-bound dolichyl-phosphate-mannose-protein mannosyltransferase
MRGATDPMTALLLPLAVLVLLALLALSGGLQLWLERMVVPTPWPTPALPSPTPTAAATPGWWSSPSPGGTPWTP